MRRRANQRRWINADVALKDFAYPNLLYIFF